MNEPFDPGSGTSIDPEVARRVRLVVLDVDGVLTDGGVYLGATPEGDVSEFKRFDIQDGLGIKMLMWAGIEVAIVSGRLSGATTVRAQELGVEECHQDALAHKLPVLRRLLERKGLRWDEIAMVADDVPDLPVLRRVGLPVAVANAVPEVLAEAAWRTASAGGRGAVREFARALLRARGDWERVLTEYLGERDD